MEQITKSDEKYYYGDRVCESIDDAYRKFRDDYHKTLGRNPYARLDRLGQREERIHGFGFVRDKEFIPGLTIPRRKVKHYILGLVCLSYTRGVGCWDMPGLDEYGTEQWLEYAFTKGSKCLSLAGRRDKRGRTNRRFYKKHN